MDDKALFNQVFPLYIGAKCTVKSNTINGNEEFTLWGATYSEVNKVNMAVVRERRTNAVDFDHIGYSEEIKLHLRPLSDLTDKEKQILADVKPDFYQPCLFNKGVVRYNVNTNVTLILLLAKWHIDAFELIEKGLAISTPLAATPENAATGKPLRDYSAIEPTLTGTYYQ